MIVFAVVDDALSPDFPLGVEFGVFIRREDAERFVEEVRGDDPALASYLRVEEREPEAAGGTRVGLPLRRLQPAASPRTESLRLIFGSAR